MNLSCFIFAGEDLNAGIGDILNDMGTEKGIIKKEQLIALIRSIHEDSYGLCKRAFGKYFSNAGNVAIFCHSDREYTGFEELQKELTEPSDNPNRKYFKLYDPIFIPAERGLPEGVYTYLYVRKPDPSPYGRFSGDVDFFTESEEYLRLKESLQKGVVFEGAEIYDRPGWDMIQISNPNISAVAYVSIKSMTEKVRVRF